MDQKTPVDELEFSVRGANAMQKAGIKTIGDLTAHSERRWLSSLEQASP